MAEKKSIQSVAELSNFRGHRPLARAYLLAALLLAASGTAMQFVFPAGILDLFYHDRYFVIAPSHVPVVGAILVFLAGAASALFARVTGGAPSSRLGYTHLATTVSCVAVLYFAAILMASKTIGPHDQRRLISIGIACYAAFVALVLAQLVFLVNLVWRWFRRG